jgi:hypothetical protein
MFQGAAELGEVVGFGDQMGICGGLTNHHWPML